MELIQGGVCASKGFLAGAVHCGVRKSQSKLDLAVIYSKKPCAAVAVYTTNQVKADCLKLTKEHLSNGKAQAIICNSGNANACAPFGKENALKEAIVCAKLTQLDTEDVIVASTGVIGQTLPIEAIEQGAMQIELKENNSLEAAQAIMTTDTKTKSCAVSFELDGIRVHLGGICKGSGMIHPNMGTMLAFITSDVDIESSMLEKALQEITKKTFNRISVDGDTSTNDMCVVLANGMAKNKPIQTEGEAYDTFKKALHTVMENLAIQIASDGEGASRLLSVTVYDAQSEEQAEKLAKSVASSTLFKSAMFGSDANWGRVLCAMGYSQAAFDPEIVDVTFASKFGKIQVCQSGKALDFDEEQAKKILKTDSVQVLIDLHQGDEVVTCWGCDLTYDYVKINGDYRT